MSSEEEEWSTVINTKKIKSLEKRDERRRVKAEYEQMKRDEEALARGEVLEESEDEDATPITIGADFNELVRVHEKKAKEESKKQAVIVKQAIKQKKEKAVAPTKLQAARTLSTKVSNEMWKSELEGFSKKFPNQQDIQLKYLADFFLETFNNCSEQRPTIKVLDKDVIAIIQAWLSKFPQKEMNQFLVFLIEHELETEKKNSPGIAILVDYFCVNEPNQLRNHKISAIFKKKFGSGIPNKSYSFLHQVIWSTLHSSEPQVGLYFFMEFLTKIIAKGSSPHAEDVVKILESLKKIKLNNSFYNAIGLKNVLRACENLQISGELRTRIIQMIGPLIQLGETGVGEKENFSNDIFLQLLAFATVNNNEDTPSAFQNEIFEQMVTYLTREQDSEALDGFIILLCKNYFENTVQVNNFLRYLVLNWQNSKFSKSLEKIKDKFVEFSESITQFNEELLNDKEEMNRRKMNPAIFQISCSTCEDLGRVIKGGSVSRATKDVSTRASSVGFGRIAFTVILIAVIYYIFANDIQFTDIRDFVRGLKKQYKWW